MSYINLCNDYLDAYDNAKNLNKKSIKSIITANNCCTDSKYAARHGCESHERSMTQTDQPSALGGKRHRKTYRKSYRKTYRKSYRKTYRKSKRNNLFF